MFKWLESRVLWGALLILAGLAFLLQNIIGFPIGGIFWGVIFGIAGLVFLSVYISNRQHWWALIPAGVMFTLAIVAGLDQFISGGGVGGIFFLGLGLTFALIALLPTSQGRMRWAWIPAGVLIFMGMVVFAATENIFGFLWPIALILVGVFFVFRALIR